MGVIAVTMTGVATVLGAPALNVNGTVADYATFHYYIDESAGQTDVVTTEFWPNEANVTQVELFSNLNRRDLATLTPPDAATIVPGNTTTYYGAYTMTNAGGGKYVCTLPIQKTGAYRLTARYKVSGDNNWRWYGKRDAAVVVSDVAVRDLIMYEVQVNSVDATGDDAGSRSTFADLMDSYRFNLDYVTNLGVNTLWLMPFHPIGGKSDGSNAGQLGSPYSIKNMWKVAEHLGDGFTRDSAMQEFKAFMAAAESKGVSILFDTIFNHTATDAEIERNPDNPEVLANDPLGQIRYLKPNWYSRYTGGNSCQLTANFYDWSNFANNSGEIGPAPADRHDFGKWCDAVDLFWGTYSALGNPTSEADGSWNASAEVRKMTEYHAYFFKYWLQQTDNSIDGFRCDFAQGLPPQAWEYLINKAKSIKPELAFMAESLDGGAVSKRAGRQFDIINDSWVWAMIGGSANSTSVRAEIDSRKASYGYAGVMRGIINHDQSAPADKWWSLSRYAIGAAIDGQPQMFMGQELGYRDHWGFSKFRNEYDRWIPQIRDYYNMQTLWNDTSADKNALWNRYAEINKGRQRANVLRQANQYYLDLKSGGTHSQIFTALKYEKFGWDVADQEVVLAAVSLTPWTSQSGTFNVNVAAIYLNPTKLYNIRNLASTTPGTYLWAQARTGADIAANGITVSFSGNGYNEGSIAQFLKLEAVGSGPYQWQYGSMSVAGTFNGWNLTASPMSKTSNGIWTATLTANNASAARFKFVANGSWAVNFGEGNQSDKDLPIQGQTAEQGAATDILVNGTLNGDYKFTFNEQTKAYTMEYTGGGIVDTDADGLSDAWEIQYFGNLSQGPNGDPDGDGKSNMTEYLAGWNPTVPNYLTNYSSMTVAGTFNGWNAALNNMTQTGDYTWQATLSLTNASAVRLKFTANGGWAVNFGESNQTDKDLPVAGQTAELGNGDILVNGTLTGNYKFTFNEQTRAYTIESLVVDTDADGLPDSWEILYFSNLAQGPNDDPDADGKTNLQEYLAGSNPTVKAFSSQYTSMTLAGTFNGWNAALNNMTLVADKLWEVQLTLTNASATRFKFTANGGWAVNFGTSGQQDFNPNMEGLTQPGSSDILVNSVMSGTYKFTYNELTGTYQVTKVTAFSSAYSKVAIVGTFNGWNSAVSNLQLVGDGEWQGVVTITGSNVRFKFIANGGWAINWGEQNQSLFTVPMAATAELGNFGDITVSHPMSGNYVIGFNEATRQYSVFQ